MSTPEDLRIDAIAEMAADRHDALHVDLDYFDPDCGLCRDAEREVVDEAYALAGYTGRSDAALAERWQDGDR